MTFFSSAIEDCRPLESGLQAWRLGLCSRLSGFFDARLRCHQAGAASTATASESDGENSLFEAATRAYEHTKGSPIGIFAYSLANSSDDILIWYWNEMTRPQNGNKPLIILRGIFPPSRNKEEIYIDALSRYDFVVENSAIILQERTGSMRYDLSVSASEVASAIAELAVREMWRHITTPLIGQ
jgi:hypothetical protein